MSVVWQRSFLEALARELCWPRQATFRLAHRHPTGGRATKCNEAACAPQAASSTTIEDAIMTVEQTQTQQKRKKNIVTNVQSEGETSRDRVETTE